MCEHVILWGRPDDIMTVIYKGQDYSVARLVLPFCFMLLGSALTGGGAGGRMMVSYTTSEYTGTMVAYGGSSDYSYGGAGTIYTVENNAKKTVIVDNGEPYTVTVSSALYHYRPILVLDKNHTDYCFTFERGMCA